MRLNVESGDTDELISKLVNRIQVVLPSLYQAIPVSVDLWKPYTRAGELICVIRQL